MLWLFQSLLVLAAMLWLVPVLTDNNVRVHGGFIKAALVLIGVSVFDVLLWTGLTVVTLFADVLLNFLTLGLIGLLVNALAYLIVGRLFPRSLYVRDYMSAFAAAAIMTIASWGITHFIH
jgi:uncharacterized membrane protein YvlD (DUF360 family)